MTTPKNDVHLVNGVWWPKADSHAVKVVPKEVGRLPQYLRHVKGRHLVVQAGGNVGMYPCKLAEEFQIVITFEPDPLNYYCLTLNVQECANKRRILSYPGALGEKIGRAEMHSLPHEKNNYGARQIRVAEKGPISIMPLDSLHLENVDFLMLDVEGSEAAAVAGAWETIQRSKPTISMELKGLGPDEDLVVDRLIGIGYVTVDKIGRDLVMTC